MPRTIWKFPLQVVEEQALQMPIGAKVLHVGTQGNIASIWAEVDPTAELEKRWIYMFGTGHSLPALRAAKHLGTFMMHDGTVVYHVFCSE
jgi:hypothetical protein